MHSKDLITLKDDDGYIDISSVMKNDNIVIESPQVKQSFVTDDGVRVFWKPVEPGSFTHFAEVIASHIARQFNLPSTKYFFAKYKGVLGTISRDYKKPNETELLGRDFLIDYYKATHNDYKYLVEHEDYNNIIFVKKALKYYVENNNTKISLTKNEANHILEKLLLNYMLDIALLNADCHHKNWGFLLKEQDGKQKLKLIPSMDKERSFFLYLPNKKLLSWVGDYYKNKTHESFVKMQKLFQEESLECTPAFNILPEGDEYTQPGKPYLESMKELKELFPNMFHKLLEKFYEVNLPKAYASVEKETGVTIPPLVKFVVANAYETRYFEIKAQFGYPNKTTQQDKALQF
jgi:hypothetical protein